MDFGLGGTTKQEKRQKQCARRQVFFHVGRGSPKRLKKMKSTAEGTLFANRSESSIGSQRQQNYSVSTF